MQKNSQNFSTQALQKLAHSREGKALLQALERRDPEALHRAGQAAAAGDYAAAGQALAGLLKSSEVADLLDRWEG